MSNKQLEQIEVKNENISVAMTKEPGAKVTLNISVSPKFADSAFNKAVKTVNKEVSLPGFRKGKAPEAFILENFGKQVDQEWRQTLLQMIFPEALDLIKIHPYRQDSVRCSSIKDLSREGGGKFTIEFEAAPQVPQINLSDMVLKNVTRRPIAQEDIDQVIENLQHQFAQWVDVTDRAVQESDYVDLDIDRLDEPAESICRDTRFSVSQMAHWMKKLVIGSHLNDSVEGTSEFEPSQTSTTADESEFRPTRCQITIKAIKYPELPDRDALVNIVRLPNFAELEERIVADLNRRADEEVTEALHRQVDEQMLAAYHFDLPRTLLDEEKKFRMEDTIRRMQERNASESAIQKVMHDMEVDMPVQVERSCRLYFLILGFARQHNLTVSQDELGHELSQRLLSAPQKTAFKDQELGELRSKLSQQILMRKVRDYIISHVRRE